jgi:DNA ligase-1
MSEDNLFLDGIVLNVNAPSAAAEKLPTLYTRSSGGALQEWTVEVDGNRYRTIAGQVGGTLTTSSWTVCEGKNIGRSNETTPEKQAAADAKSKWKKKKKEGGSETVEAAGKTEWIKPMLAQTWQKLKKYPPFPLYAQRKYNGMRCVISARGMYTRKGEKIISAPHIFEALRHLFIEQPDLVLDGELYNHTLGENLNRIIKLVRKTKHTTPEIIAESKRLIKFYLYDGYNVNGLGKEIPYLQRRQALNILCAEYPEVYLTETVEVKTQAELDAFFEVCKTEKYEGEMIRVNGPYETGKRSKYLIKRKDFIDEEFVCLGVNEGTGNAAGMAATFTCKTEDGTIFYSNLKGSDTLMREIWANPDKYIGKEFTCVFQNYSEFGVPQFPYIDPTLARDYE